MVKLNYQKAQEIIDLGKGSTLIRQSLLNIIVSGV